MSVFPELTPTQADKVRRYSGRVNRLISANLRIQKDDLAKVRSAVTSFRRRAIMSMPARFPMNRAAIVGVLDQVTRELDVMTRELGSIMRTARTTSEEFVADLTRAYGDEFLPPFAQAPIVGLTPEMLITAEQFSADLIGLRTGGLAAGIQRKINTILRTSVLGAGPGAFAAAGSIWQAMGNAGQWAHQAERIYRTEVLRIQSVLTEQSIRELNEQTPTSKQWRWSGISRREHQSVNGQVVGPKGRFKVPLRDGGTASMRFPRDSSAPPSATVNCGCYVIPVPRPGRVKRSRRRRPVKNRGGPP